MLLQGIWNRTQYENQLQRKLYISLIIGAAQVY